MCVEMSAGVRVLRPRALRPLAGGYCCCCDVAGLGLVPPFAVAVSVPRHAPLPGGGDSYVGATTNPGRVRNVVFEDIYGASR